MTLNRDNLNRHFERIGEKELRVQIGQGVFAGDRLLLATEWLRQQDQERSGEIATRDAIATERANSAAERAAVAAELAAAEASRQAAATERASAATERQARPAEAANRRANIAIGIAIMAAIVSLIGLFPRSH